MYEKVPSFGDKELVVEVYERLMKHYQRYIYANIKTLRFCYTGGGVDRVETVATRLDVIFILFYFYFILQNSPYIRITITQQNLHTLNKCHTHNGWNDHTEMKSPITGFQYKT